VILPGDRLLCFGRADALRQLLGPGQAQDSGSGSDLALAGENGPESVPEAKA